MKIEIKERKTQKKIIFDVPENWHTEIKTRASMRNISMKNYILQAIAEKINEEKRIDGDI